MDKPHTDAPREIDPEAHSGALMDPLAALPDPGDEPSILRPEPRAEPERFLSTHIRDWQLHERSADQLLQGEDLDKALHWAKTSTDITLEEREYLLQCERESVQRLRAQQEEEQVRGALLEAEERARQRDFLRRLFVALSLCFLILLGALGWQSLDARQARKGRLAAEQAHDVLLAKLSSMTRDVQQAGQIEARQKDMLADMKRQLAVMQRDMDEVRRELGQREARLRDVSGKVARIFKKRIVTRGPAGPDTGISDQTVDEVLLLKGWPTVRTCFPVLGPMPEHLGVEVQVQPDGSVSEVAVSRAAGLGEVATGCVAEALRGQRFPAFSGAHFIRISYEYERRPPGAAPPPPPQQKPRHGAAGGARRSPAEARWWPGTNPAAQRK